MKEEKIGTYTDDAIRELEKIINSNAFDEFTKITKGETFVLKMLFKRKEAVSPTELSKSLNSSKARISAILNSLDKKGEIKREIDLQNRRNIKVTLTEAGKEHIIQEIENAYNLFEKYFTKLGEKDSKEFIRILKKISE